MTCLLLSTLELDCAVEILHRGGLVGIPTETVYGLAGDALNPAAVARIFEAKQRPHFDPLIVHIPDLSWLPRIVSRMTPRAILLAERFWPGPLTLVLPKTDAVPDLVTSGLPSVAVRIPSHPLALDLIRRSGTPLAAPSANPFGRISPTTAVHVVEQLGDRIDAVVDGGPCTIGVESTVLQLPGDESGQRPLLLRPGGLSVEELEQVLGPIETPLHAVQEDHAVPAPGMLTKHYAPRTPLTVLGPNDEEQFRTLGDSTRLGLLSFGPTPCDAGRVFESVEVLSVNRDLREAAAGFFAALRRLDAYGLDRIFATPFPEAGLGRALNDRLRRAAAAG